MALTDLQMSQLSAAAQFQKRVAASAMRKALAILGDVRAKGTTEAPVQGQTPNYNNAQKARAASIGQGQSIASYYLAMACSTNFVAGGLVTDGGGSVVDSDVNDASLDSQVYTTVFLDLA